MKQIGSIQILRALAALMVVLAHAQDDASFEAVKAGVAFSRSGLLPWVAGVDLFFVVSGFIMVHASERLFATPGAARAFLVRRVIRIVPLYWLVTMLMLVVLALLARHGEARMPGLAEIVTSLGFLPYPRPGDGVARPIMSLGWTLNYEMFFYVVFAAFVTLRRDMAVAAVAAWLMVVVALGELARPTTTALAFWSDPIVLEFVFGMGIALLSRHGARLPPPASAALAALAVGVLSLDLSGMGGVAAFGVDPSGFPRLLACGLPMAALFAAIVMTSSSSSLPNRLRPLLLLGDASYALYLFHPLVVVMARKGYLALHLAPVLGFWPLVLGELVIASTMAIAIHLHLERPITRALHGRFATDPPPRRTAAAALPARH